MTSAVVQKKFLFPIFAKKTIAIIDEKGEIAEDLSASNLSFSFRPFAVLSARLSRKKTAELNAVFE